MATLVFCQLLSQFTLDRFDLFVQIFEMSPQPLDDRDQAGWQSHFMLGPGIGPSTASVLAVELGDAHQFANARQFAASIGLVPRQYSTGGKPTLLGISKRGDKNLR